MARIARHVRVRGRVQGVFFRAWTREQAERLDVFGWVRNASDGSVVAHLEGSEDQIAGLIELLKRGPSGARVDDLEVGEVESENHDVGAALIIRGTSEVSWLEQDRRD